MERRMPVAANAFYEGTPEACRRHVEKLLRGASPPEGVGEPVGAIVPHAGWVFSGATAAKTLACFRDAAPELFVLCGAVHRPASRHAQAHPEGVWVTPLGEMEVDAEALAAVKNAGIEVSSGNHKSEHSIEVQLPLIQALCPHAMILPIGVPHDERAASEGLKIGEALKGLAKKCAVVGSTDLTHYGMGYAGPTHGPLPQAMPWMRENDARFIRLVEALDADAVVPEAAEHANACGAGAVAATMAAARVLGATRGVKIEYTTSAEALGEVYADRAVGYLGALLVKE